MKSKQTKAEVCISHAMKNPFYSFCAASAALLITASFAPTAPVSAQGNTRAQQNNPVVDTVADGRGRINYASGAIRATGYGAPPKFANTPAQAKLMALGAARADALRTLAMTVSSVQVTSETKVKNYELQSDVVQTKISALLQSPRIVSETTQPDGTAQVVVEMSLYGPNSVAAAVFPEVLSNANNSAYANSAAPVIGQPYTAGGAGANANGEFVGPSSPAVRVIPAPRPAPLAPLRPEPGLTPIADSGPFTAVIVDCRGLGVEAIMSPKLMDTTGREVYGTVRVSPEYAIETGVVSYPRSMSEAVRSARAGSHPLIVRGLRVADKHRFNPVISLEDADRILASNNRDGFLEKTRVIFLVDPVK